MRIKIPKLWDISENKIAPESVYMDRRRFLKGVGAITAYAMLPDRFTSAVNSDPSVNLSETEKTIYPARRNESFSLDRKLTRESVAARYNNFYEFSEIKEDVSVQAQKLSTRPWTVKVSGLVHHPQTFDVEGLLKTMPMEERLCRHRCVEAWAMAVPWTGFPLKALLDKVQPLSKTTHVLMKSFYKPFTAQGQLAFWYPWPYTEAITLREAMNELAFMALGIYGHPLPKQHGAPIRLVMPWKYGFKSIKSVVQIELVDYQPATFWNTVQGLEYDFTANVNPNIPHPRWSQAREKMLGTGDILPTQIYNGYADRVASLY
ncbi:MAG: mononuclear molybdenum enzyme YedY [Nitrospinae bacterium RIFCSPLOWO2_12_FULL_47_7]|nr:MAG: mononuclear molybdenum enzyme YedY [Nitrospinae bacterium RIFCSPLOWO2_12_FULL_47_7]